MADWENVPVDISIERVNPPTLVSRYEDGTEDVRQKSANSPRIFTHRYVDTAAAAKSKLDFIRTRLLLTSFTIITFDPEAASPDTEEATVRLASMPVTRESAGGGIITSTYVFREVL